MNHDMALDEKETEKGKEKKRTDEKSLYFFSLYFQRIQFLFDSVD